MSYNRHQNLVSWDNDKTASLGRVGRGRDVSPGPGPVRVDEGAWNNERGLELTSQEEPLLEHPKIINLALNFNFKAQLCQQQ